MRAINSALQGNLIQCLLHSLKLRDFLWPAAHLEQFFHTTVARSPICYVHMYNCSRGQPTNSPSSHSLSSYHNLLLKYVRNLNYRLNRLKICLGGVWRVEGLKKCGYLHRNDLSFLKQYLHTICDRFLAVSPHCAISFASCSLLVHQQKPQQYTYCDSIYNRCPCINRNDSSKCKGGSSGSFSFLSFFL